MPFKSLEISIVILVSQNQFVESVFPLATVLGWPDHTSCSSNARDAKGKSGSDLASLADWISSVAVGLQNLFDSYYSEKDSAWDREEKLRPQ